MRWLRNQDISIQLTKKNPLIKYFPKIRIFSSSVSTTTVYHHHHTFTYILATSEIVSHFSVRHNKRRRSSLPIADQNSRKNSALLSRHQSDWYVLLLLIRALAHTQKRASSFREILHGVEITAQLWSVDPCVQNRYLPITFLKSKNLQREFDIYKVLTIRRF